MNKLSRRNFIRYSGGLMLFTAADVSHIYAPSPVKLSFSTLGCPDWTLDQITDFAVKNGFQGLEIRGIQRQVDLTKSPHFNSDSAIKETKKKIADKGLKIVGLGSSAALHHKDVAERDKSIEEAKQFIDIAHKVGCPYIRVFPNNFPKEQTKEETMEIMSKTLTELGNAAKSSGVKVLMETHGDLVHVADIETVMKATQNQDNVGLVWDVSNMWTVTQEKPADVYPRLKKWIRHTHLKNLKISGGKDEYTLFTDGEVPIFEAIDLLSKDNYKGYYSFEWEKLWHPEILDPEIAIADYATKMKEHFEKK